MNAISIKVSGKKYYLNESGAVLDESMKVSTDSWTSFASVEEDKNTLSYTLNGVPQRRIRVRYSFNSDNQLVASLFKNENPELDEDSVSVIAGGISSDTSLNLTYAMINAAGEEKNSITVYGSLTLENPFTLKINLVGGGEARIVADAKEDTPIEWDKNRGDVQVAADDLLRFKAITANNLNSIGGEGYQFSSSALVFAGAWGMDKNGLFFDIEGGTDKPIRLTLKGKYKAVSGGLIFEYENGQAKFAMAIGGRHKFEQGTGTWNLCIGYSQEARKTYTSLKLDGELKQKLGSGRDLTLSGTLKYESGTASTPSVALEINATYQFKGGACLIKAFYDSNGQRQSYGLQISGYVQFKAGKLTYNFSYGSSNAISFNVLYDGTSNDFLKYFRLKVKVDSKGKVTCDFSFKITFRFENGVLLPPEVIKDKSK